MKLSLNWLKQYISVSEDAQTLADQLTMAGLEIEEIVSSGDNFSGVVVGRVESVEKHPNADKLSVCQVNTGQKILQIVCGAPNVAAGQTVPVATVGAVLPGDFKIKPVKLRGMNSSGMICSSKELELDGDHSGIMVLDNDQYQIGQLFSSKRKNDTIFEVNVTPNRPDCLSVLGIAREVGAIQDAKVNFPGTDMNESQVPASDTISIEIEDADACPRYVGRTIQNVKIGPSPDWLKTALETVGIRSINNIVDITNFVLMETGHPLHAFDYAQVAGQKIIVRKAKSGEKFTTLDDTEHTLTSDDLLICDNEKPVALAGVMGGLNSEVTKTTTDIFLESAYFDPMTIRKTAKRLGISTEASQRFERGADPENTIYAIDRAAALMAELAGGEVCAGRVDANPRPIAEKTIPFRFSRIQTVLGVEIPEKQVMHIFSKLGFKIQKTDPWQVAVPTFRPDLLREIDLIEEVVRHFGYDKIEPRLKSVIGLTEKYNEKYRFMEICRDIWTGLGCMDTLTNSLVSKKHTDCLNAPDLVQSVLNPLSPETAYLRNHLIPSLLDVLVWNINRQQHNVRLFEIGRVFNQNSETRRIAGLFYGQKQLEKHWSMSESTFSYYDLKGTVYAFLQRLNIDPVETEKGNHAIFQSGLTQKIMIKDQVVGWMGAIDTTHLKAWDIDHPVFAFDLDIDTLLAVRPKIVKYRPISRFPGVKRDLAILVDKTLTAGEIIRKIRQNGGQFLASVDLFDLYEGKSIPESKKSLAFSLTFISQERTLKDKDIDPMMTTLLKALKSEFGATLRE